MDSRRNFVGKVAYGLAGTLAAGPSRVLGANARVRVGIIGAGDRGMELANHLRACTNTDIAGYADIYSKHRERVTGAVADYRDLLASKDIDAVVIATPQHLHAAQFQDALGAGKHVYLEKTAAFNVAEAKQMRSAYRAATQVVQIGHQACSTGHVADVQGFLSDPTRLGKITAIAMQMHRNTPTAKPQWARPALFTPELRAENIDWAAFLGTPGDNRGFDADRFVHWRYFWDYSGGTVFEHMSQQLSFWYKTLNLQIPTSANMQGGIYLWKDGREVPDTVSVTLRQPEDLMISWVSGLGNNQLGITEDVLGTNGSISRASQVKYTPQKMNRADLREATGHTAHAPQAHMQNFIDAIRLGTEPSCPFDLGYRVSIACRMAIESYRQGRTVRWDARREEIA
jgi:predicted dehydrogenase